MEDLESSKYRQLSTSSWIKLLEADATDVDYVSSLRALLSLTCETDDRQLLQILSDHTARKLLQWNSATLMARVVTSLPIKQCLQALRTLTSRCNLSHWHTMILLCSMAQLNVEAELQSLLTQLTKDHLTPFAQQLASHSIPEQAHDEDIAEVLSFVLLVAVSSKSLEVDQSHNLVYAVYQYYPDRLPQVIADVLDKYDSMNQRASGSETLALMLRDSRGQAVHTNTSIQRLLRHCINQQSVLVSEQIGELILTLLEPDQHATSSEYLRLGAVIGETLPNTDWAQVIQFLDAKSVDFTSSIFVHTLLQIIINAVRSSHKTFEISQLWSSLSTARRQADIILYLASVNMEYFTSNDFLGKKVLHVSNFVGASPHTRNAAAKLEPLAWNSLDLLEASLDLLALKDVTIDMKKMLEWAGKQTPELIFLGCVQLPQPWSVQQDQLCEKGFEVFFRGQDNSALVFHRLWQIDAEFMCRKFVDSYNKEQFAIIRICDVAMELGIVDQLLNLPTYNFVLDLASIAGERDLLNLEKWLVHKIQSGGDDFIVNVLRYLATKAEAENAVQQAESASLVSVFGPKVNSVATFLKGLMNSAMSLENGEILKQVQSACIQVFPRLMSSATSNRKGTENNSFAKDVEREVEFHYGKLYEGETTIVQFIEMLQRLKSSTSVRDQDIFACMLHSLFDEYRFFADYPESALNITAVLFGSLIQNQLLSYIPLGIALRYVLDAATHDPDSSMFRFGVKALQHFKKRVSVWPQYCQQILNMPSLLRAEEALLDDIRSQAKSAGLSRTIMLDNSSGQREDFSLHTSVFAFRSLAIKERQITLSVPEPSVSDSDRILFNINNMSLTNLSEKVYEVRSVLRSEHYSWFARHLVSQRAAVEPNYHSLYLHFLMSMNDVDLMRNVLLESIDNIARLLNSEGIITSTIDRGSLKNLGSWLGLITLGQDRPIRHKDLSLKDLLVEGYNSQRLIVVLPFVCRVIEQVGQSRVFKPPNPWTLGVLALLKELYEHADMKLNLKFEVEVLCQKLAVDLQELTTLSVLSTLKDHEDPDSMLQSRYGAEQEPSTSPLHTLVVEPDSSLAYISSALTDMTLAVHPLVSQLFPAPELQAMISSSIQHSLIEFILPIIERSVAVASISTSQLIFKDFAYEEDAHKMRSAAHAMNQTLASSLTLMTCKEPLKTAVSSSFRLTLNKQGYEITSAEHESAIQRLVNDNIDEICVIVEQLAMDRALKEIDDGLAGACQARSRYRDFPGDATLVDPHAPRHSYALPDPLRLKSTGLTTEQLNTYNDFIRVPRTVYDATLYYSKEEHFDHKTEMEVTHAHLLDHSTAIPSRLLSLIDELEHLARETDVTTFNELPRSSPLYGLLHDIDNSLSSVSGPYREEHILTCAQRICHLLFRYPYKELTAQALILVLRSMIDISLKVYREISLWLMHSEDSRKLHLQATTLLLQARVINPVEFDIQLAKQIMQNKVPMIDFSLALIAAINKDQIIGVHRGQFLASTEALQHFANSNALQPPQLNLWREIESTNEALSPSFTTTTDDRLLTEQIQLAIEDWVQLISHPSHTERHKLAFLLQLQAVGILGASQFLTIFIRSMLNVAFSTVMRGTESENLVTEDDYFLLDCTCDLIILLHKYTEDSKVIGLFLDIAILLFASESTLARAAMLQRAMVRLFSNLLSSDLISSSKRSNSLLSANLDEVYRALVVLRPQHFPHFSFGWLMLISHRSFMPPYLSSEPHRSWPLYCSLLTNFLSFMSPLFEVECISTSSKALYQAFLRLILVLLNDFPGLLSEHYHSFMNAIPIGSIQLRNLILSAFPKSMHLPDPFLPGLKVDRLPESATPPCVYGDFELVLTKAKVLIHVHSFVYAMSTASIPKLALALQQPSASGDTSLNSELINTLVLHCGIQAMGSSATPPEFDIHSTWVTLLHEVFKVLGPKGRYQMLNAVANQLRYPNRHTYFFSCILLWFFSNGAEHEALNKEQITRVLLERLICNRPHPWGLLITFTELLKNSKYGLWEMKFIRASPEIETLFLSLFNHINQNISQSE